MRVLVVDDDRVSRVVTENLLIREGFMVDTAASGREAVSILERFPPSIILLDWMMPGMDGIQALAAIRDIERKRNTRSFVIMVTSRTGFSDIQTAFNAGVDDYVMKPLGEKRLKSIVAAVRDELVAEIRMKESADPVDVDALISRLEDRPMAMDFLATYVSEIERLRKSMLKALKSAELGKVATILTEMRDISSIVSADSVILKIDAFKDLQVSLKSGVKDPLGDLVNAIDRTLAFIGEVLSREPKSRDGNGDNDDDEEEDRDILDSDE